MRDSDFYSHESAARFHDAPLPPHADASLHVTTVRPHRAAQAKGVVPHSIDERAASTMTLDGMRIATPALTWAMLGESFDVAWLVAVGDFFCRVWRFAGYYRPNAGQKPLATPDNLASALNAIRWRGIAKLRAALPLIRLDSWSPMESLTRVHLVTSGLPEPDLNRDAYDRFGVHLGCLDMSYPELKIAVEYQGQLHGRQYARDIERVERLRAEGWIVIQVTSELLKDRTALVRRVRDALVSRGWSA
ncbi:hypothetical protein [Paramicrobacterium agarici]|nr:hypothetical protein [Microbacterium agarici]